MRYTLFTVLALLASGFGFAQQPLRYKLPQQPITYLVKVTCDAPWAKSTYQGRVVFSGVSADNNLLTISYKGGLKTSEVSKVPSRPGGPGGPFGHRGAPSPFPFNRSAGPGALRQTSSKVIVSTTGNCLAVEGDTQFPLPLGELSLLMFEPLPSEWQKQWTTDSGVLVGKAAENNNRFPHDPFARPATPGKTSSGSEVTTIKVTGTKSTLVNLEKSYAFAAPNASPAFEVKGGGTLAFDTELGWMTHCDVKYDFKIVDGAVTVTIPLTVEYEYLTYEQVAALDLHAQDAAKKAQEAAKVAADKKHAALIKSFSHLSEDQVNELYRKGAQVSPTDREISADLRVPAGLIIISKWRFDDIWQPAKVIKELPNGQIEFESVESKKVYQRDRKTLALAPDYVDQPHLSAESLAAFRRQLGGDVASSRTSDGASDEGEFRTWNDSSKAFTVEAKYVSRKGDNVVLLRKSDSRALTVPMSKLSEADQDYVKRLTQTSANPFKM